MKTECPLCGETYYEQDPQMVEDKKRRCPDCIEERQAKLRTVGRPNPTPCPNCYQMPCRCGEFSHMMNRGSRQETEYQRRASRRDRDE